MNLTVWNTGQAMTGMDRYFVPPYTVGRFFPDIWINGMWLAGLLIGAVFAGAILWVAEWAVADAPLLRALSLFPYIVLLWYLTSYVPRTAFRLLEKRIKKSADFIDGYLVSSPALQAGHRWMGRQLSSKASGSGVLLMLVVIVFFSALQRVTFPRILDLLGQGRSLSYAMTELAILVFCTLYAGALMMTLAAALMSKISDGRWPA